MRRGSIFTVGTVAQASSTTLPVLAQIYRHSRILTFLAGLGEGSIKYPLSTVLVSPTRLAGWRGAPLIVLPLHLFLQLPTQRLRRTQ
jgi:hypothetical protein